MTNLFLAQLVGQLNVGARPDHHGVVDPNVILVVFPALGDVQRRIAVQIGRDAVAQMLQIEDGRCCETSVRDTGYINCASIIGLIGGDRADTFIRFAFVHRTRTCVMYPYYERTQTTTTTTTFQMPCAGIIW